MPRNPLKRVWKECILTTMQRPRRFLAQSVSYWFRTEIFQEILDKKGVLVERSTNKESVKFALFIEFDGDENYIRHVMYNCTSSRPSIESETKEDTIEPGTETLTIAADLRTDGLVKSKAGDSTDATTYANWYLSIYVLDMEEKTESGGGEG